MRFTGGAGASSVAEGVEGSCFMRLGEPLGGSAVALRLALGQDGLACSRWSCVSGEHGRVCEGAMGGDMGSGEVGGEVG